MFYARDLLEPIEEPPPASNKDTAPRHVLMSDNQSIAKIIPVPPDLDLTGDVAKTNSFRFESGGVADVSQGSVINSRKIKGKLVAIKVFRRIHTDGNVMETIQDLYAQCELWAKLNHPNILSFLGVALDLGPSPALISPLYRSPGIMEYLSEGPKSSQQRYEIIQGIAQGLLYLHSQGLVHGNLTTKKVLISDDAIPNICGYGLANISTQSSKNSPSYTPISPSARFTAPEYYINAPAHKTHRIRTGDVYSFSMVVLEIMSGIRPFHHLSDDVSVLLHILPGGRPSRSELDPLLVSNRLWGFLKQLWNHQPALRPEMNRVILMLQSLQSDSDKPDGGVTEIGSSILYSNVDEFDIEEEVSFGHPCLAEINSQDLSGRLFRTDEYPYATGGNSNIYRGQLMHRNGYKIRVAIKLIRVSNDGSGQLEELLRRLKKETRVWSRLNHRNILPFLGVWDEPIAPWPALISPFYNSGDLKKYLTEHLTCDKEKMIIGVTAGIECLHRHGIVHGDLKVHNVLVDKNDRPCICDFGISRIINARGFTTSSVGTPPYMAPELFVVLGDVAGVTFRPGPTTLSSDVYSVALLILEILNTNSLKHRPLNGILTAKDHGSLRPRRSDYDSASVSSDFWSLLDSCWEPDPDLRPTIQDQCTCLTTGCQIALGYHSSLPEALTESPFGRATLQSLSQAPPRVTGAVCRQRKHETRRTGGHRLSAQN
ncbi:kinase-like domain-containing protein [Mycena alexandri]|uniref:Kinase-like domain-containing protein n=1 Tax=Mycena alexandri TaxID=1745969 RepID=A0AAD6WZC4_9AGAR|nr:kinase-like domain-containing protein [Mycena alexandri]